MTFRRCLIILIVLILIVGCATVTPTPNPAITRPTDFSLVYKWQEGSLPPPYHYEYTITIDPAGQGQIVMIPDYAFNDPPQWTETFTLTSTALDQLYGFVIDQGVFVCGICWQTQEQPPVGGSYDLLHVTAYDQQITIPFFMRQAQNDNRAVEDIATTIHALVPQASWDKLNAQREQYVADHHK